MSNKLQNSDKIGKMRKKRRKWRNNTQIITVPVKMWIINKNSLFRPAIFFF